MAVPGAQQRVHAAALQWEGVTAHAHRFGGTEYRLGRREIGHTHGDALVDIPFPKAVRDELVAAGRAEPHHILPESGWVSFYIRTEPDVQHAIDLLRRSVDIARASRRGTGWHHDVMAALTCALRTAGRRSATSSMRGSR